ncbi:MAG: DUF1566 domain-containing protein [Nitrospinaceae bacterium]|nr:DUF1566 domain-containing protein [Nitrospinaceae bacterium]NIR55140.1 DUF1566 domain-containing protein [Nitrospinaceae bacterium]NIS85560.1 DUF1566 domain-containing protein [Nitrospinaceae bacterium]NIT82394.1 DUF1566 domain-containing protein [Nitrospinaceae bacterium]NIU44607.1 DUF1566 domain-containing protein [Nitrospinaceae bacterium]
MRIILMMLAFLLVGVNSAYAACSKKQVCKMLKTMGHFDILNKCPGSGKLLAECKKVSEKSFEKLPNPQFVDNKNGTVTDTVNKLVWAQKGYQKKHSLKTARDFAAGWEISGITGWRLPTLSELATLMQKTRVKNVSGEKSYIDELFDDGTGHYYWTATTCDQVSVVTDRIQKKLCQQGTNGAWLVHFNMGAFFWHFVTAERYFVWPVKDLE